MKLWNYTTGISVGYVNICQHASSIHIGSQVKVVCSMENCDVSPSTLTGCARGPSRSQPRFGHGSASPWSSTATGECHVFFFSENRCRKFQGHHGHGPPMDFLGTHPDSSNFTMSFFWFSWPRSVQSHLHKSQVRLQTCTVPEADPSLDFINNPDKIW